VAAAVACGINFPLQFRLPEDGLSGMMIVTTQSSFRREGHPVSVSHSVLGPSSSDAGAAGNEGTEDVGISGLLGMLESVTDPRSPRGKRHALAFVLAVSVVATLAGAENHREIASHAADMPQRLAPEPHTGTISPEKRELHQRDHRIGLPRPDAGTPVHGYLA
jgi:DDE_Tnp_1-associated